MASGSPCLNSRWDQPKSKGDMLQGILGNVSQAGTAGTQLSSVPTGSAVPGQSPPQGGGVEMAAAMAAKINAMLMAKGKLKPLQPLPSKAPPSVPPPVSTEEVVVTEVDINDVPVNCRNLLTKGKTQEEIRQFSGAVVSTKGLYMSDSEKSAYTGVERPLYLHVQGRNQDEVNKAVMRIKEIISEDILRASGGQQPAVMPPVPVYPQPPRPPNTTPRPPNTPVTPAHRPPPPHSGSFVHTKIFVGLEQSLPGFSVNEKVEGPSGSYLQHIQTETGARVFLRGKGSGYIEQASRRESFEPLYLYISHPNSAGLDAAKKLCESLLETVRAEHARALSVFTGTGSTQVYPAHSYSSQSWYGYPANGYSSAYPAYPAAGSYWNTPGGASSQNSTHTPSDAHTLTPAQGMVQYPVCPRQSSAFLLQDEAGVSGSSSPSDSRSPKRRFIEDSKEEEETQTVPDDPLKECEISPEDGTSSDGVLMPPPPTLLTVPTVKKRARETEQPAITHTDCEEEEEKEEEEVVVVKKVCLDSSGLVPYGGDSSDEEEERIHTLRKNDV